MRLSKLKIRIDTLESVCEPFLHESEDSVDEKTLNIALKVKAFDEIIAECKEEVESADIEHKIHVLKLLYGLEVDDDITSTDDSLDDYVSGQIDNVRMRVNERKIKTLKNIISNVDAIIEELAIEYKNTLHVNLKLYRFQGIKLKRYRDSLKKLINLKEKLSAQLESDSKKISFIIIENFYNLYIFFSFLISVSIYKNRELVLIDIANRLDRYIDVIEPSFSGRFLHHEDMIYHYAIYEIKDLKNKIFTELAAQ